MNSKQERSFKGVWIPKELWVDRNLTDKEKLFLVEINSLDNDEGCFATNAHFAEFFNISKRRVIEVIQSLIDKGYIGSEVTYKHGTKQVYRRTLKILKGYINLPREDMDTRGGAETCTGNNTSINININTIVEYLNNKLNTRYKTTTKSTRDLIKARLNQDFTVDDFKVVIDKQYDLWHNKEDMSIYLRPSTLFGNNFEGYLNSIVVKQRKDQKLAPDEFSIEGKRIF